MPCKTIWGHNGIAGAPSLYGQVGQGIVFFDAVLVNGYGSVTLDSLVVSSGMATGTYSSGHTFPQWTVIGIAGVTDLTGLNGKKRILTADGTTFTFDATGVGDGAASGTISAQIPGGGWTKEFSGTNKAMYRNDSVFGTGCRMRVDDAGTLDMRVVWYLGATDVDTGTDPFPTNAQVSGGCYLRKSSTSDVTARAWVIALDDRAFYLGVNTNGSGTYRIGMGGDYVSFASVAPYDAFASMGISAGATCYSGYTDGATSNQKMWTARLFDGTAGAVVSSKKAILSNSANVSGSTYPSPQTGGIMADDVVFVHDGASTTQARGTMPGYVTFLNNCGAALTWATPILLVGMDIPVLPIPTADAGGPWFGVVLDDWR